MGARCFGGRTEIRMMILNRSDGLSLLSLNCLPNWGRFQLCSAKTQYKCSNKLWTPECAAFGPHQGRPEVAKWPVLRATCGRAGDHHPCHLPTAITTRSPGSALACGIQALYHEGQRKSTAQKANSAHRHESVFSISPAELAWATGIERARDFEMFTIGFTLGGWGCPRHWKSRFQFSKKVKESNPLITKNEHFKYIN